MPVIPVNPNHPAASTAHKRMPSAGESPLRAVKTRANNALLHGASASATRCHDVTSVAAASASVATNADNVTAFADAHAVTDAALAAKAGSVALPARSVPHKMPNFNSKN